MFNPFTFNIIVDIIGVMTVISFSTWLVSFVFVSPYFFCDSGFFTIVCFVCVCVCTHHFNSHFLKGLYFLSYFFSDSSGDENVHLNSSQILEINTV